MRRIATFVLALTAGCQLVLGDMTPEPSADASSAVDAATDASATDASPEASIDGGSDAADAQPADATIPVRFCADAGTAAYCTDFDDEDRNVVDQDFTRLIYVDGGNVVRDVDAAASLPYSLLVAAPAHAPTACSMVGATRKVAVPGAVVDLEVKIRIDNPDGGSSVPRAEVIPLTIRRGACLLIFRNAPTTARVTSQFFGDGGSDKDVAYLQQLNANYFAKFEVIADFGSAPSLLVRIDGNDVIAVPKPLPSYCASQSADVEVMLGSHCDPVPTVPLEIRFDDFIVRK